MKNKIRQFYSIMLNKKTNVFLALALGILIVFTIMVGGLLMNLFSGSGIKELPDSVYQAMLMIIDPGFLAVDSGFIVGLISLIIVLFGMIVFLGGSIGYICSLLSSFMDSVKDGSKKVYLYDHLLILNWNSRTVDIFAEESYRGEIKNIFILVKDGRDELVKAIKSKRAQLKKMGKDYHHVNCFVREGDLFSNHELIDAGVERARTIVILDDEDSCRGQNRFASMVPVKILMLISKMHLSKEQTIIVESADEWTKGLIEDIEAESDDTIVAVATNEILGKMLAQISIMPELNEIYGELMSHRGNEFYSLKTDFSTDDKYAGIEAFMNEHKHGIPLNIMKIDETDYLFAMGENLKEVLATGGKPPVISELHFNKNYLQPQKNIVIIGKNSKQNYIYDCYAQYVIEHGENSLHIDRISTEEGLLMVRGRNYISEYRIEDDFDKQGIQSHLKDILSAKKVDSILILSDDSDDSQSLDTEALIDLVNVKRIIKEVQTAHHCASSKESAPEPASPELVVEILDPKHLDIAGKYGVKSIVFSNQYISRLITQFGDSRSLYYFFSDLFAYDSNEPEVAAGRFRSKEIYVRTAGEVFDILPPELPERNLSASAYYSSPRNNTYHILGYIKAESGEIVLFGNNMDERKVKLVAEDKIIVYCRH